MFSNISGPRKLLHFLVESKTSVFVFDSHSDSDSDSDSDSHSDSDSNCDSNYDSDFNSDSDSDYDYYEPSTTTK